MVVPPGSTVALTASALLSLLGVSILVSGLRGYRSQSGAIARAESASGSIESVGVQEVVDGPRSTYVPAVEYEYQTPTQRLHGKTVYPSGRFAKQFHSESAAEAVLDGYEAGSSVTVYYDPADPERSFLVDEPQRGPAVAKIVFGVGLVGLAAVVLVETGVVVLP